MHGGILRLEMMRAADEMARDAYENDPKTQLEKKIQEEFPKKDNVNTDNVNTVVKTQNESTSSRKVEKFKFPINNVQLTPSPLVEFVRYKGTADVSTKSCIIEFRTMHYYPNFLRFIIERPKDLQFKILKIKIKIYANTINTITDRAYNSDINGWCLFTPYGGYRIQPLYEAPRIKVYIDPTSLAPDCMMDDIAEQITLCTEVAQSLNYPEVAKIAKTTDEPAQKNSDAYKRKEHYKFWIDRLQAKETPRKTLPKLTQEQTDQLKAQFDQIEQEYQESINSKESLIAVKPYNYLPEGK
jgi:hypothetical protein